MLRCQPAIHHTEPPIAPSVADEGGERSTEHPLSSEALLQGRNSVSIDHEGTLYTLRTTRAGKLILTK